MGVGSCLVLFGVAQGKPALCSEELSEGQLALRESTRRQHFLKMGGLIDNASSVWDQYSVRLPFEKAKHKGAWLVPCVVQQAAVPGMAAAMNHRAEFERLRPPGEREGWIPRLSAVA